MSANESSLQGKSVLLVVGGGIAAYKCLDVVRRLRDRGVAVRCVLTSAAKQFVTALSFASLSGNKVYEELFSLTDEAEMGHIRLSREADLVVVAPATADLMAKMAQGLGNDLASTILLATDKRVLLAPAMNPMMWDHPATRRNVATLQSDGAVMVGPNPGAMACGEVGSGRMAEPAEIVDAVTRLLEGTTGPLTGCRALVTSGPTHEAIDPVRYIANRSSGRQGHAIAAALAALGAEVTLVSGPVAIPDPPRVRVCPVESAREMLAACEEALPVDVAVFAAAVADWRPATAPDRKLKKDEGFEPRLDLTLNPDILATIAQSPVSRPRLVVGFAAETGDVLAYGKRKLEKKGCDWLLANDVSVGSGVFGGDHNTIVLLRRDREPEFWPRSTKADVAQRLAQMIAAALGPACDV